MPFRLHLYDEDGKEMMIVTLDAEDFDAADMEADRVLNDLVDDDYPYDTSETIWEEE